MKLWYKLQLCSRVNEIAWEYAEVIHRQWNTLEQKASSGRTPLLSVTRSFSFRTGPDTSHHLIYTGHEQITRLCRHLYCFLVYVIMVWSYVSYKHWLTYSMFDFISQAMVIFAYAVAVLFFDVYDMAIDTLFLCFCEYAVNVFRPSLYNSFHSEDS